ncbi:MAG TPA: ABC transporter substrate-binding protein, partial [Candidatus Nanoarchaeia archaeon]|nr:ABC transporter substrate-binding protein [Candidatus Nanoarchaeia archaeon]
GLILKQAKEWKLNATFFGADTITSKGFAHNAGLAMEGLYFTSWDSDSPNVTALKEAYQAKYNEPVENILFTVVGYDAVGALAQTMQGGVRGVELKNKLYQLKDYPGLSGSLIMSEDGMVRTMHEQIFQVKNAGFVRVEE